MDTARLCEPAFDSEFPTFITSTTCFPGSEAEASASSAKYSELAEALKAYCAKAENYLSRLEQADIERAKAVNGEKFGTFYL